MRVVFDTVVFVRALLTPEGPAGRVNRRGDEYELIVSDELEAELLEVLSRPELRARLGTRAAIPDIDALNTRLRDATRVTTAPIDPVCRDPDDDKLFACAAAAAADYIVSDDNDVLAIGEYRGARTISTADFERLLGERSRK